MSNLLPPAAKQQMRTEYIARVVAISLYGVSVVALAVALLTGPSIILLNSELAAIAPAYEAAQSADVSFQEAETVITAVNSFVDDVETMYEYELLLPYLQSIFSLNTPAITIRNVAIQRDEAYVPATIVVRGEAVSRSDLAAFKQQLEALPIAAAVDLPIENLAKDVDVPFSVTVKLASNVTL